MDLSSRCREVGLTAAALAPALGVSPRTVRRWMAGEDMPESLAPVLEALLRFRADATRPASED